MSSRVKGHCLEEVKRLNKGKLFPASKIQWYAGPITGKVGVRLNNVPWKKGYQLSCVGEACKYNFGQNKAAPTIKNAIVVVEYETEEYQVIEASRRRSESACWVKMEGQINGHGATAMTETIYKGNLPMRLVRWESGEHWFVYSNHVTPIVGDRKEYNDNPQSTMVVPMNPPPRLVPMKYDP